MLGQRVRRSFEDEIGKENSSTKLAKKSSGQKMLGINLLLDPYDMILNNNAMDNGIYIRKRRLQADQQATQQNDAETKQEGEQGEETNINSKEALYKKWLDLGEEWPVEDGSLSAYLSDGDLQKIQQTEFWQRPEALIGHICNSLLESLSRKLDYNTTISSEMKSIVTQSADSCIKETANYLLKNCQEVNAFQRPLKEVKEDPLNFYFKNKSVVLEEVEDMVKQLEHDLEDAYTQFKNKYSYEFVTSFDSTNEMIRNVKYDRNLANTFASKCDEHKNRMKSNFELVIEESMQNDATVCEIFETELSILHNLERKEQEISSRMNGKLTPILEAELSSLIKLQNSSH